jgi:subtilisin family serine protease
MKCYRWMLPLILLVAAVAPASAQLLGGLAPASAQQRIIVRDELGLSGLNLTCLLLNCQVSASLGDPSGQLFVITINTTANPLAIVTTLLNQIGIVDAEVDQQVSMIQATAGPIPESLLDETPLPYYGSTVWTGYATQPAAVIIQAQEAQQAFNVTGAGIVAMIDTGVDTQHPALVPVLVTGYNFINNTPNGSETGTLNQSSAAVLDGGSPTATLNQSSAAVLDGNGGTPVYLNGQTIAVLNQSSAAVLDGGQGADYGHGTMTAGIVHLVAPTAQIMPLKAFSSDGTGYLSNIIRATYYAVQHSSKVISMSFDFTSSSTEMGKAIKYATQKGIICVASAGNDGVNEVVYPAGYAGVMGVASTSDLDTRSTFSSYGSDVWVAAPGEGIVSTYPNGTYSAGWGTSFSAPFVSGTAALLVQVSPTVNQQQAAAAIANAVQLSSPGMGNGRLDVYQAVQSFVEAQQ